MSVTTDQPRMRTPTATTHRDIPDDGDDAVLDDIRAFYQALEQSPQELVNESLRRVVHHRQTGTLTADEAETLIRQLAAAAIEAHVRNAFTSHLWLPFTSPTPRRHDIWRSVRRWHRAFAHHKPSSSTP